VRVCEGVGLLGLLAQFYSMGISWAGPVCILGRLILKYLGLSVVRVFRVPWLETRITRNNFEYHGLKPEIVFGFFGLGFFGYGFGFFGFGFWVSGNPPTHSDSVVLSDSKKALWQYINNWMWLTCNCKIKVF